MHLFAELGFQYKPYCRCHAKPLTLDAWGPRGSVINRGLFLEWLAEAYEIAGWLETVRAGWRGAAWLNPLGPFGSLLGVLDRLGVELRGRHLVHLMENRAGLGDLEIAQSA